jgi:hypothetical protein
MFQILLEQHISAIQIGPGPRGPGIGISNLLWAKADCLICTNCDVDSRMSQINESHSEEQSGPSISEADGMAIIGKWLPSKTYD